MKQIDEEHRAKLLKLLRDAWTAIEEQRPVESEALKLCLTLAIGEIESLHATVQDLYFPDRPPAVEAAVRKILSIRDN